MLIADAVLESLMRECSLSRQAAASLSNVDVALLHGRLLQRLQGAFAAARVLPRGADGTLALHTPTATAVIKAIASLGVVSTTTVKLEDLVVDSVAGGRRLMCPGETVRIILRLTPAAYTQPGFVLSDALAKIASCTIVSVTSGAAKLPVVVASTMMPAIAGEAVPYSAGVDSVVLSFAIPTDLALESALVINATFCGRAFVNGISLPRELLLPGLNLPLAAPLELEGLCGSEYVTPTVSADGTLFVPFKARGDVRVFSALGIPTATLSGEPHFHGVGKLSAVAFDDRTGVLVCASSMGKPVLRAFEPSTTGRMAWEIPADSNNSSYGIAVIPVRCTCLSCIRAKVNSHLLGQQPLPLPPLWNDRAATC
jgi:hypothetical protein